MEEAQLVAAVVGTVAALRRGIPKIDGLLVVVVAVLVAALAVFAYAPAPALDMARHAVRTGLSAIGIVFVADRFGRNAPDPKGPDGGTPPSSPYRDAIPPPPTTTSAPSSVPLQRSRAGELAFAIIGTILLCGAVVLAAVLSGCGGAREDVKAGLDVSDAVCTELEKAQQDEPEWVKFACTAVHVGNGLGQTFLAKVRREDAAQFASRHCPKGDVAP